MTQEEFIKVLEEKDYSYEIEGDKIVVTYVGDVYLDSLTSIPPVVEFNNRENVHLALLTYLPSGVVFKNGGSVFLKSITSLPPGVKFKNGGNVYLHSLASISPGVEFKNEGDVYLGSLMGHLFFIWYGNIEGINPKRLLNLMIKKGMFI